MIKKSLILLLTMFLSNSIYSQVNSENEYLFEISFLGKSLENKSVNIYVDNEIIFENILFKDIPYGVYKFEKNLRYKAGIFELYSIRKGGIILKRKEFKIKELNKVKVALEIKGVSYEQTINANTDKFHYLRYENENLSLIHLKRIGNKSK